jgi:hypothetical protein
MCKPLAISVVPFCVTLAITNSTPSGVITRNVITGSSMLSS